MKILACRLGLGASTMSV